MIRMFIFQIFTTSQFTYDTTVEERFFNPDILQIATIIQLPVGRRVSVRRTVIVVRINKMMAKVKSLLVHVTSTMTKNKKFKLINYTSPFCQCGEQ